MALLRRLRELLGRTPPTAHRERPALELGPRGLDTAGARVAPEHRVSCRILTDFDEDGASVQLALAIPFMGEIRFLDSAQAEATLRLLEEALPRLQALERCTERDAGAARTGRR